MEFILHNPNLRGGKCIVLRDFKCNNGRLNMSVSVPSEQAFDENGRTEAKKVIVNQVLSENVGIKKGVMVWSCTGHPMA